MSNQVQAWPCPHSIYVSVIVPGKEFLIFWSSWWAICFEELCSASFLCDIQGTSIISWSLLWPCLISTAFPHRLWFKAIDFPFLLKMEFICLTSVLFVALRIFPRQEGTIILTSPWCLKTRSPHHIIWSLTILQPGSANFFCLGLDSKYFRFCLIATPLCHCSKKGAISSI